MVNPHLGKFVRCKDNAWGIGKLIDSNRESVVIEYFDSPVAADRTTVRAPWSQVTRVKQLGEQTRVYYHDRSAGYWRIGRVQLHVADGEIFVQLPNSEQARLLERDVYVRWDRPLPEPWLHLAARVTETPYFHERRHRLLDHFVEQRAATGGMDALISAPVELELHQLEVVRRVLRDPVQRYLLADEVGLGKTIEAGIIARQHVLDFPSDHRVLIIAPASLIEQWKSEMRVRCLLAPEFGHRLEIISAEAFTAWQGNQPSFLIIDEAHQIGTGWTESASSPRHGLFEKVRQISAPTVCPNLLLLSATPIRRNEAGFFALLHLLDPAVYDLKNRAAFEGRVAKRQELADIFAAFTEDQQPFFLTSTAEQISAMFPDDARLSHLLGELRSSIEQDCALEVRAPQIRAIRAHMSETYRVHRRLLRNRRNESLQGLLPGRQGLVRLACDSGVIANAEKFVEAWRQRAANGMAGESAAEVAVFAAVYQVLLEAAWSDIESLATCFAARRALQKGLAAKRPTLPLDAERSRQLGAAPNFPGELEIIEEFEGRLPVLRDQQATRQKELITALQQMRAQKLRVVCMSISREFGDEFFKLAHAAMPGVVARHDPTKSDWRKVWDSVPEAILVCDALAEEGVNLQGKNSAILHLDLPFAPNRVEQRMGRLDRYGVGNPVKSFVLVTADAAYLDGWVTCLDQGWNVFRQSIASLQYLVEDLTRNVATKLFLEGVETLQHWTDELKAPGGVRDRELKAIQNQDELDALDLPATELSSDWLARLEQVDAKGDDFRRAFDEWMVEALQFIRVGERDRNDTVVRYHFRYPAKGDRCLMSAADIARWMGRAFDPLARHIDFSPPLTRPAAFVRQTALHRGAGLARLGHPLVDGLHGYLGCDDRGTCFAFWRKSPALAPTEVKLYFCFDFVVEADLASEQDDRQGVVVRSLRRRADAALPPFSETVWIGQDFSEPSPEIIAELSKPCVRGTDKNLNPSRWPKALARLGDCVWSDLCAEARDSAEKALRGRRNLDELAQAAYAEFERTTAMATEQIASRLAALATFPAEKAQLQRELATENKRVTEIAAGLRRPRLRLDAAGAVFLAGSAFEP
ncbi:RNA polymerase-associated protein RapA [Lacunisphaera limnophila]|uniref:RNA polymerase-associated protein RapA n=1 Tax=Lacunisphaera limnophila TaxID=1838286 RepID=A0A1D8AYX6_9BACT|nr:protein DpdE [Lacunisphaera limnophila]AOS46100.1 RNA polymerase-associated protein RapA [Lacunisphaera limnophila]